MSNIRNYISKHRYVIPLGIIVLLLMIYLILCSLAPVKDFLGNTTINGIDVSNMTVKEATSAIKEQYEKDSKDMSITYSFNDQDYIVSLVDNISLDADKGVKEISEKVKGNFLMRGYYYLFDKGNYVAITINDDDTLLSKIEETKLLECDTKVATTYEIGDGEVVFTKGKTGKKIDQDGIIEQTKEALSQYDFKTKIDCKTVTSSLDDDEMETIYDKINGVAQNATLSLDEDYNYTIVEESIGASYELETAQKEYDKASEGSSFTVEAEIVQPTIDKATLEKNLFKDVLGEYTTSVSGTSVRRNNVKLAASKCNVILLPGETFSYNDTVGQRTKANGFGEAAAYLNGETVQEVGGGVCQVSSTLYNAVVLSNLEVVERSNHTYISSYVPLGRDATVSWGGPDFKFKNNSDYPIKIVATYNGKLNMKIYGTDLENTEVEFTYEKLSTISPKVTYKTDDSLDEGTEKVEQKGSNGAKVQTYRTVYKNGKLVSKTKEAYSYYKAHERIVIKGTKKVEQETETTDPNTTTDSNNTTTQQNNDSTETNTNDNQSTQTPSTNTTGN